jgi:hypothetical protein
MLNFADFVSFSNSNLLLLRFDGVVGLGFTPAEREILSSDFKKEVSFENLSCSFAALTRLQCEGIANFKSAQFSSMLDLKSARFEEAVFFTLNYRCRLRPMILRTACASTVLFSEEHLALSGHRLPVVPSDRAILYQRISQHCFS